MTINIASLPSFIRGWLQWFGQVVLLTAAILFAAKAIGAPVPFIASIGWQEAGVFLAGAAYALR